MKKLVMSLCLMLGVAFTASAAGSSVFDVSVGIKPTNDVTTMMVTAPLKEAKNLENISDEMSISCTVTVHSSITYHGVSYAVSATSTASTCEAAGAAAGAAIDNLQKKYPEQ